MRGSFKEMVRIHPAFLILAIIFSICLMASGFAQVKVGDYLQFHLKIEDPTSGNTVTQVENEVIAYDAKEKFYRVKETQTVLSSPLQTPVVQINEVDVDELLSVQDVSRMLKDCVKLGGKRETLKVPAGSFKTCKISGDESDSEGTTWYAEVPQGLVRSVIQDAETGFKSELVLQAFRFGK